MKFDSFFEYWRGCGKQNLFYTKGKKSHLFPPGTILKLVFRGLICPFGRYFCVWEHGGFEFQDRTWADLCLTLYMKQEKEIRTNNSGKEHTRFFWVRWPKSWIDFIFSASLPEEFLMESELDSSTCFVSLLRTTCHPREKKEHKQENVEPPQYKSTTFISRGSALHIPITE